MKFVDVENRSAIIGLMRDPVVFPAESQVESEVGSNLPLILEIRHVESAAILVAAPWGGKGNSEKLSVHESRFIAARTVGERKVIVGSLALVQPDPPNLHARLE